jgi:ATP-binding protein involved in chromosome partitioning
MGTRIHPQDVMKALSGVREPSQQKDIVALGMVKDVEVGSGRVSFTLLLSNPSNPGSGELVRGAREAVAALGVADVQVRVAAAQSPARDARTNLIPNVKSTVAVASGKGGVGKSTVAANLAIALHLHGAKVGLMDTDVYGPSVPMLMGGRQEPAVVEGKIAPPIEYGIKLISMGYFLPKDDAVIWRGPMLHKTIQQFLGDVRWGELDYLVIDMPPGTGDIQLSLCQTIPLTGAVIVSTPQDLALNVASKAIAMFQKLNVPVIGLVENMSYFICPHCGQKEEIFGHGGARTAAQKLGYPFLGEIPLDTAIRAKSDSGKPVALDAGTPQAQAFQAVAAAVAGGVKEMLAEVEQEITIE